MEPPQDTASLRAQIANLQAELDSLRDRYDTLLEAKTRAAERYKADYKKWRDFKQWLFGDVETDEHTKSSFLKSDAYAKVSALGKRKYFDEFGPNVDHEEEDDYEIKVHDSQDDARDVKVKLPLSSPVSVASRKQRRKSYHGESSNKESSPGPSLRGSKDPFLSRSTNRHDQFADNAKMSCKAEFSRSIPLTEPRKGRGRYAQAPPGMGTINSRFSIRKDRNDGVDFQYDAVVRNREERKHMLGSDCECCHEYYKAVGPLPASRQPLWRTPTKRKSPRSRYTSDEDKENTDENDKHKQLISRHRHHWHRAKTPPGYWDIGFPDTQEVLDINRRAEEMHKRKLLEVAAEAMNDNGRYVERAPRTP